MRSIILRILGNQKGNVAIIFALSLLVLLSCVGGGIDFMRAQMVRTKLQDAGDTAVISSVLLGEGATDEEREKRANNVFNQHTSNLGMSINKDLITLSDGAQKVITYKIDTNVPTIILGLIGIDYLKVTTLSQSSLTIDEAEIVFVLDSTYSMKSDNRMTNLKASMESILPTFEDSSGKNVTKTKIAVVPFTTQVRITEGVSYDYINYGKVTTNQACKNHNGNLCNQLLEVYKKVCGEGSNSDVLACLSSVKAYYKEWKVGSDRFVQVEMKGTHASGSSNRIYHQTEVWKYAPKWNNGGSGCTTNEFGTNCWSSSGSWGEQKTVHESKRATSDSPDLSFYNEIPAGMITVNTATTFYDTVSEGSGYGEQSARIDRWTTSGVKFAVSVDAATDRKANWKGCIMDRNAPYDAKIDQAVASNPDTLYPAKNCADNKLKTIQPLTEDLSLVRAKVDSLDPNGETNITIGVQWGMEAFTPYAPLTGGGSMSDDKIKRYMILITDGDNTRSRFSTNTAVINGRTQAACSAAKAAGITIYVIKVIDGDSNLLRNCASSPDKFYDLAAASQMTTAMNDIVNSIKKIRLTQ